MSLAASKLICSAAAKRLAGATRRDQWLLFSAAAKRLAGATRRNQWLLFSAAAKRLAGATRRNQWLLFSAAAKALIAAALIVTACMDAAPCFAAPSDSTRVEAIADRSDLIQRVLGGFTPENRLYARVRQAIALAEPLWDVSFALLLLFTGASARLRDRVRRTF